MNELEKFNSNIHLNEEEFKRYEEFRMKHKKSTKLIIDWGSGIGIAFIVKSGKHKLDITDYSTW